MIKKATKFYESLDYEMHDLLGFGGMFYYILNFHGIQLFE